MQQPKRKTKKKLKVSGTPTTRPGALRGRHVETNGVSLHHGLMAAIILSQHTEASARTSRCATQQNAPSSIVVTCRPLCGASQGGGSEPKKKPSDFVISQVAANRRRLAIDLWHWQSTKGSGRLNDGSWQVQASSMILACTCVCA